MEITIGEKIEREEIGFANYKVVLEFEDQSSGGTIELSRKISENSKLLKKFLTFANDCLETSALHESTVSQYKNIKYFGTFVDDIQGTLKSEDSDSDDYYAAWKENLSFFWPYQIKSQGVIPRNLVGFYVKYTNKYGEEFKVDCTF